MWSITSDVCRRICCASPKSWAQADLMSERPGEKSEQPTPRRLEEALKHGQWARSAEVQTVFVLLGGWLGFKFAGHEIWGRLLWAQVSVFGHLQEIPLSLDT